MRRRFNGIDRDQLKRAGVLLGAGAAGAAVGAYAMHKYRQRRTVPTFTPANSFLLARWFTPWLNQQLQQWAVRNPCKYALIAAATRTRGLFAETMPGAAMPGGPAMADAAPPFVGTDNAAAGGLAAGGADADAAAAGGLAAGGADADAAAAGGLDDDAAGGLGAGEAAQRSRDDDESVDESIYGDRRNLFEGLSDDEDANQRYVDMAGADRAALSKARGGQPSLLVFPALFSAMWEALDGAPLPAPEDQWAAYEKSRKAKLPTRDEQAKRKKAAQGRASQLIQACGVMSVDMDSSVPAMLDALADMLTRDIFEHQDAVLAISDQQEKQLKTLPSAIQKQFQPWIRADKRPASTTEKGAYMALEIKWRALDDVLMDGAERMAPSMDPSQALRPPRETTDLGQVIATLQTWHEQNQVGEQSSLSFLAKASTEARGLWMRKPQVALCPEWLEALLQRGINPIVVLLAMRPAAHWHLSAFNEDIERRDLWPSRVSIETRQKLHKAMHEIEQLQSAQGNWFGLLVVSPQRLRVLFRRAERVIHSATPQEADSAPQSGETADDESKASGAMARMRRWGGTMRGKLDGWGQQAAVFTGWNPASRE